MSGRCDVCAKQPSFGRRVARLGRNAITRRVKARTSRMFRPNIQTVTAKVSGGSKRMRVCTSCIKANAVPRRAVR